MVLDAFSWLLSSAAYMFTDASQMEMIAKLGLAALLGGIIGYEREKHLRPAGLRTHMLVSMGACIFSMLSMTAFAGTPSQGYMAATIVMGIGFVGAGTIVHVKDKTFGLTTAASLWLTASIGVAVATGYYLLSIVAAIIGLVVLSMKPVEDSIHKNSQRR
ncbi:MAG: MgtC/SapB family protein [Candidatus Aenigmarchaeota archaeon]|nr:MgtC/SapB family protein [Candidatus Aenigmarchaeota archaeon]